MASFPNDSKLGYFGINGTKIRSFHLIHTWKHPNNLKRDGPGCKICQKLGYIKHVRCFFAIL